MLKDLNVRVNFSGEEELEKSYFVIDPNGDVNGNNGINKIGNALTNSICELWKKIEGKEDHFKRYKKVMDI